MKTFKMKILMYFFSQNRNKFVYKKSVIKLKIWCRFLLVKLKNNWNDSKHPPPLAAFLTKFMIFSIFNPLPLTFDAFANTADPDQAALVRAA